MDCEFGAFFHIIITIIIIHAETKVTLSQKCCRGLLKQVLLLRAVMIIMKIKSNTTNKDLP